LEFLKGKVSDRKLRLFAVACCRRIWAEMPDGCSRTAVELGERYADGQATMADLSHVSEELNDSLQDVDTDVDEQGRASSAALACITHLLTAEGAAECACRLSRKEPESEKAALLQDIFGPLPFRPITLNPAWLTSTVLALAKGIYAEKAFDRMPILADALQDAGCDNEDILSHCRKPGEHARGCWIVDLLLGKS
jgi:hypothetical protein